MKLKFQLNIILIFFVIFTQNTNAQSRKGLYKYSSRGTSSIVVAGFGPGFLFGDLGGAQNSGVLKDLDVSKSKVMLSLNYKYTLPNSLGLKVNSIYGRFSHTDLGSRNSNRNYNSKINLGILTANLEYNFLGGESSYYPSNHSLYAFAGFGLMYSNSKVNTTDTAGLNINFLGKKILSSSKYAAQTSTLSPVVPVGIGYQYSFTSNLAIGGEYTLHVPFTDYLDGLSPSGSKFSDYLMSLNVTLTYKIAYRPNSINRVNWN